jgi:hypothetical protein
MYKSYELYKQELLAWSEITDLVFIIHSCQNQLFFLLCNICFSQQFKCQDLWWKYHIFLLNFAVFAIENSDIFVYCLTFSSFEILEFCKPDLDKKKRGVAIALTLPKDDESKIREKVFDQIKLDDLKKDTGFNTLLEFLDKHLAKDDLADSLEKFAEVHMT